MNHARKYAKIKSSQTGNSTGAINCPNCNTPIAVSIDLLLGQGRLRCRAKDCDTVLRLNRAHSGKAIKAMKKLQAGLKSAGI